VLEYNFPTSALYLPAFLHRAKHFSTTSLFMCAREKVVTAASHSIVNSTNPLARHLAEMADAGVTFISFQHPILQLSPQYPHEYAETLEPMAKERGRAVETASPS
jgi:hypothetical protein